jgi:hypothetical protein
LSRKKSWCLQVKRLGKYKTGNLLLRKDMSEEDREVYTSLLEGIHSHFVTTVSKVPLPHVLHISPPCNTLCCC